MRAGRLSNQMDDVLGKDRLSGQLEARRARLGLIEEEKEEIKEEEEASSSLD